MVGAHLQRFLAGGRLLAVAGAAWMASAAVTVALADEVRVEHAWARATPAGADTGALYLTLHAVGGADRLVAVETPAAQMAMLHETAVKGGITTMREVEAVDVPKDATVVLRPGGGHVMLMGLAQKLNKGDHFPVTLRFAKAAPVTVDVTVAPIGAAAPP